MLKTLFAATAATLLIAGAGAGAGAGAVWAEAAPAPAAHVAHPTIESPIEALINDPVTNAVVQKHLPGVEKHPAYSQFKGMTFRQVAPYSEGHITDELIAAIDADLKALPAH